MPPRFYAAVFTAAFGLFAPRAFAADIDRYYAVSIDGKAVGYDHFLVTRTPMGVKATDDALIKLSALGSPMDITTQAVTEYGRGGAPVSYVETTTRSGAVTTQKAAFVKRTAHWSQDSSGVQTKRDETLKPGTLLLAGTDTWEAILAKTKAATRQFVGPIFDPTLGKSETLTLTHAAETNASGDELWTATVDTLAGPQPIRLRYRRAAHMIVEVGFPTSKVAIRLAGKEALKNFGSLDYTSHMFAALDAPLPNPDALTVLTLKVSAKVKLDKITLASLQHSPRQAFHGTVTNGQIDGVFTIRPWRYSGAHALAYPYTTAVTAGQSEWLKSDAFTESDDPQIKALAKTITASSKTGWEASSAIGHWVYDNIRYQITGSGARQCLASKTGDCGPHSWLTIALCRAAGVPARIQGGALYTPLAGGSYAQHYWTEVWMGARDGWVPIDSTTGEIGTFSPTHLTLWRLGGLDSMTVKTLGYEPKTAIPVVAIADIPRRANGLAAGYAERYDFLIDGKNIGAQTAELKSIQNGAQHWNFSLVLNVPEGGAAVATLTENGSFDISDTDAPVAVNSILSGGGIVQATKLSFTKDQASGNVFVGALATPKTVALTGPVFAFFGNVLTTWSLATRSVAFDPTKPTTLPFFATDALQTVPLTFTPQRADTITIKNAAIPCHVYTISPLGSSVWIADADGALVKMTDERQKLVINLE